MTYPAGEALILTALQAHANYSSDHTSRGNFKVLNRGTASYYVVLRMGEAVNAQHTMSSAITAWSTEFMVYERYKDDGLTAIALQTRIQEIVEHIEQYNTLSDGTGTVVDAQIIGIGAMQEIQMNEGGPVYLRSIITLQWQETRTITYI